MQAKLSTTALVKAGNHSFPEWIADTGATDHMSQEESLFSRYSPAEVTHRVQIASGGMLLVRGVGEIPSAHLGFLKASCISRI